MTLDEIFVAIGFGEVHSVNIDFAEEGHRGCNDRGYENVVHLAKLTEATSTNKPGDVTSHHRPPEVFENQCMSHIEAFVSHTNNCNGSRAPTYGCAQNIEQHWCDVWCHSKYGGDANLLGHQASKAHKSKVEESKKKKLMAITNFFAPLLKSQPS